MPEMHNLGTKKPDGVVVVECLQANKQIGKQACMCVCVCVCVCVCESECTGPSTFNSLRLDFSLTIIMCGMGHHIICMYMYVYVCIYVCVCVCVYFSNGRRGIWLEKRLDAESLIVLPPKSQAAAMLA